MKMVRFTRARRVETLADRDKVLAVLKATYQDEKGWVENVDAMFPVSELGQENVSWFLATHRDAPVGVLRVLYSPPIGEYLRYGLKPIGDAMDLLDVLKNEQIAEIGRFAVVPERRNGVGVVLSLMRGALRELVARGCKKLVTDVFEDDAHSPLGFHTRIIGFRPIATHEVGELRHKGRRITLLLDMKTSYKALKSRGNWFFRVITGGWTDAMHHSLAA